MTKKGVYDYLFLIVLFMGCCTIFLSYLSLQHLPVLGFQNFETEPTYYSSHLVLIKYTWFGQENGTLVHNFHGLNQMKQLVDSIHSVIRAQIVWLSGLFILLMTVLFKPHRFASYYRNSGIMLILCGLLLHILLVNIIYG
ncbi:hypothetical protein [Priestia koreensis]|uniref:hypothetical protein n=1 Tax=Priestia koreensis TaxID=284581 RepID=UPI001F59ABE1|nr:hypothetical protein [Priestia koreensis]UNL83737.1 hypothetical protein IE339_16410 [Priestia koreensis]